MFYLLVSFDESDSRLELHNLALRANLRNNRQKELESLNVLFVDRGTYMFVSKGLITQIIYVITCALILLSYCYVYYPTY